MTAGLAASLHTLSGGRFRLGLGVSGPAVVEGWHGVPFEKPVGRLRDVIRLIRLALSGEPLDYDGAVVKVPMPGRRPLRFAQASGPIDVPIYVGALGPVSQRLVAAEADGWTPTPYSPDRHDLFAAELNAAMDGAGRRVQIAPVVPVVVSTDLQEAFDLERRWSAFYLGGMGEFYARAATAMGFGTMAADVGAAWSAKDRAGARSALLPDYLDSIGLFGSVDRIRKRIERYVGVGADELVFELRRPDIEGQLEDVYALGEALR
jgi:alkanesulfonate monooxygenase SsuD/methylene tetrahydromethanopterin reductase-like flavin-dependent oxidoreductase (luciferase family)